MLRAPARLGDDPVSFVPRCPDWCVVRHGMVLGEEDWLHQGRMLDIAEGVAAQLVMSFDPRTGIEDGPYVLIGGREYTLDEAEQLIDGLRELIEAGRRPREAD